MAMMTKRVGRFFQSWGNFINQSFALCPFLYRSILRTDSIKNIVIYKSVIKFTSFKIILIYKILHALPSTNKEMLEFVIVDPQQSK